MWNPEASKLETFWTQLQDTFRALYTFPKPIVAAVNGHSPGACGGKGVAGGARTCGWWGRMGFVSCHSSRVACGKLPLAMHVAMHIRIFIVRRDVLSRVAHISGWLLASTVL